MKEVIAQLLGGWVILAGFGPIIFCGITDRPFSKNVASWSMFVLLFGVTVLLAAFNLA